MYRPGHGNLLDKGPEPAQEVLEKKIRDQRVDKSGQERWEALQSDAYQSPEDAAWSRERSSRRREREEKLQRLIEQGPLRLTDCLAFSLECNDEVQAKRAAIQAVGGDELIVRSRFLPHLFFNLDQESKNTDRYSDRRNRTDSYFRLSQALLEFGKDNPADVALRESQRRVLFEYEDAVRAVLSDVRLRFFTVLLREQQLGERTGLLEEFRKEYEKILKRYEKSQVVEVDLLTARLNMLNEETRINSLKKEILRQKIDLMHFVGFPVGLTDFDLAGELETLDLDVDKAVETALGRSTDVAQSRAVFAERQRQARQVWWEYGPDIRIQSGWKGDRGAAGVELSGEDGSYGLAPFAEQHLSSPRAGFTGDQEVLDANEKGLYLGLGLEFPLYEGMELKGRRIRENARALEARHALGNTIDRVEQEVRKAYQTMLEQREELRILEETVAISKKRLRAKERLKELDRITDDELETFRDRYFRDQDAYFSQQIAHVTAQERLRSLMRQFEALK